MFSYASSDQAARGVSIRQWGPQGRVFLYTHLQGTDDGVNDDEQSAEVEEWECLPAGGGYDYCENIFLQNHEVVGATSTGAHLLHPAAAIRHQGGGDLELTLSRLVKNYGGASCPTNNGEEQWDLVSYLFEPDHSGSNDITATLPINAAFASAECADYGMTELAYDGATPHGCYTAIEGSEEFIQCNDDDGTGTSEWTGANDLSNDENLPGSWDAEEDHPSFVIAPNGRIVAAHRHNVHPTQGEKQNIEVTFPDSSIVDIDSWTDTRKNFPNTSRNYDGVLGKHVLRVVWEVGDGTDAELTYASCHTDCDIDTSWSTETITDSHRDAQRVQHVADAGANREFVVFSYDSRTPFFGSTTRVVLGTRCMDQSPAEAWAFDEVRPSPASPGDDQKLNYGRPSIALDKVNDMVMVGFVEASNWDDGPVWDLQGGSDGDVVFARADYSGLTSCTAN